jgi:hypothetical protein
MKLSDLSHFQAVLLSGVLGCAVSLTSCMVIKVGDASTRGSSGGSPGPSSGGLYDNYQNTHFASFSGWGHYLELAMTAGHELNLLSTFSICALSRSSSDYAPSLSRWHGGPTMIWFFGKMSSQLFGIGIDASGTGIETSFGTFLHNTWQQVCLLYDGGNSQAWVDGVNRTETINGTLNTTIADHGISWRIGNGQVDVDSVVFYSEVISSTAIQAHRCALTEVGAGCTGQTLTDVVNTPGFVEFYGFDSVASLGTSLTGNNDMTVNGTPSQPAW